MESVPQSVPRKFDGYDSGRYTFHMKRPYIMKKRGKFWYYRLPSELTFHSTGETRRERAENIVVKEKLPAEKAVDSDLSSYIEPFFTDRCPHVQRLRAERKAISPTYIDTQHTRITKYILTDPISKTMMADLRRSDILDFRQRLLDIGTGVRTVNCVIGVLKIVCREAYFREEIDRDPTAGIGEVKYNRKIRGTFTVKELRTLFKECPGVWKDIQGFTAFLLAATTGMRRGEILELRWDQIDFKRKMVNVSRARTDNGMPKFDKLRVSPLSKKTIEALQKLRKKSLHVLPGSLVFCYPDGEPLGFTWWKKRFGNAMDDAQLDQKGRELTPHSFRHTLNSRLREKGIDSAGIRAAMGWADDRIQEEYTHWNEWDKQRKAVDGLFG